MDIKTVRKLNELWRLSNAIEGQLASLHVQIGQHLRLAQMEFATSCQFVKPVGGHRIDGCRYNEKKKETICTVLTCPLLR